MAFGAQESARARTDLPALTKALHAIITTIGRSPELGQVLQVVMAQLSALFAVEAGSLLLLDEETGELRFERALANGTTRVAPYRLRVGQGIAGWVVEKAQSLLVPNVQEDPRFYRSVDQLSGFQTRSILCVPLMIRGRAIGAIELINKVEGPFTAEDLQLLEILAGPVAIAVESATLYARMRRQMSLLNSMHTIAAGLQSSQDVAQATSTYIQGAQDLGFPWVELFLVSRDQQRLEPASYVAPSDLLETFQDVLGDQLVDLAIPIYPQNPYGDLLEGQALATREQDARLLRARQVFPVELLRGRFWPDDPRWSRVALLLRYIPYENWLVLPVQAEGRIVGVLLLAQEHNLTREDAIFLNTFTGLLGQTLDRLQAEERIRQRNRELTTLIEGSAAVSSSLDPEQLLEVVGRQVISAASADACWISDWDPVGRRLLGRVLCRRAEGQVKQIPTEDPFAVRPVEEFPLVQEVIESRLAQTVNPKHTPLSEKEREFLTRQGWRHWILLPMIAHGQVIGMIELGDAAEHIPFGTEEMRLCCVLAEHAAVALQNSRLFAAEASVAEQNARLLESARIRARQLEIINEVARATSSILHLDQLSDLATELIQEKLGYAYVALGLVEGDEVVVHSRGAGSLTRNRIGRAEGLIGWVATHGEPQIVPDTRADPRYQEDAEMPGALSEMALPLLMEGEVVGVLDVRSHQLEAFSTTDLQTLQPLADQLAITIAHARLFERLSRSSQPREADDGEGG